jgi:lysophospholipase L1-like esterase
MSFRRGDPDSNIEYFRALEDRITSLEQRSTDQTRQSTREIRLRAAKKLTNMMVIGDSLAQFDRCNKWDDRRRLWLKGAGSQRRWQDQLATSLAGITGLRQFLPTIIGPFTQVPAGAVPDLTSGPAVETIGTGGFTHWDYTIPGAYLQWFVKNGFESGYYPPARVAVDLLVVAMGTNDYSLGRDPNEVKAALGKILTEYQHRYAVVLIPWKPALSGPYAWQAYLEVFKSFSAEKTMVVESVAGSVTPPTNYLYDGIHLTQDGHNAVYDRLIEALGDLVKNTAPKTLVTGSTFGATFTGGIVIDNWRISVTGNGELIATNLQTNKDTVIGV